MTTPRLLVISHACAEPVNWGVYLFLAKKHGVNVRLVIPKPQNPLKVEHIDGCQKKVNKVIEITQLESTGSHLRLLRLPKLLSVIKEWQPTHILVDGDPACYLVKDAIKAADKTSTVVWVMSCENMQRHYLKEAWRGLCHGQLKAMIGGVITWWLWKKAVRGVDRVFSISNDGTAVTAALGFKNRVTQIPLGFDPALFYPQSQDKVMMTRKRLGLNKRTVAYFGRIIPEKGLDILLGSLAQLKDVGWQFLIDNFSDYHSSYVQEIKNLIQRYDLASRVIHFDANHREMPDYMSAADIVVLPSITTLKFKEQYGRVIPEAMACGKVVVGSSSGAIPELIGDCGFVFPEKDVDALAATLRQLLLSPDDQLRAMGQRAQERAHTKLSIVQQADIFYSLMQEETSV